MNSNSSSAYSNYERRSPVRIGSNLADNKIKTTPFFNEYDPVLPQENANLRDSQGNQASSQGFVKQTFGNNMNEMLDEEMNTNDACIDCVSYLKRISIGTHNNQVHKLTAKSKPYYTHLLVEHYNDEDTINQIIDELLETADASHNAKELLLIIASLITKEEQPVLQTLIKTDKYIISK